MQIPQVTVPASVSEPGSAEDEKSSANKTGGEKGAFAILLALLQGTAPAQAGSAPMEVADSDSGESNPAPAQQKAITASVTPVVNAGSTPVISGGSGSTSAVTVAPATGTLPQQPPAKETPSAGIASTNAGDTAKAVPDPEGGKTVSTVKPVVVTEVATPMPSQGSKPVSSAHYVVPESQSATTESSAPAKPVTQAAPAKTPVAEAEAGIPVAKLVDAETTEVSVESKPTEPVKPNAEPEVPHGESRSSARFVVAKPDNAAAEPPKVKAAGTTNTLSPAPTTTPGSTVPEDDGYTAVNAIKGEETAIQKEPAKVPGRTAATQIPHAEGTRPTTVEGPPSNAIQIAHAAPSNGSERVKADLNAAPPQEPTTVKSLAIDTVKGVRYLLTKGEQTMRIRLVPESLGEVKLVVTSTNEEISVRLASANHSVRELLHTQVHQLREALAQDGANVGKITIAADWNAGSGTGNPLSGSPDRAWTPHARGWTGNSSGQTNQNPSNGQQPVAVPRRPLSHSGTLNLFA